MNSKDWYLVEYMVDDDRQYTVRDSFITQNPDTFSSKLIWKPGFWSYYKKKKIKVK